jgi:hypothetical protein
VIETLAWPVNPLIAAIEMVRFCDDPGASCTLPGLAAREKSGGAGGGGGLELPELLPLPQEHIRTVARRIARQQGQG